MKHPRRLQRRLDSLHMLDEAIGAIRTLSAHQFRLSRDMLPATRAYRDQIDLAFAEAGIASPRPRTGSPGILVIGSDLGLCGDYNSRLVNEAVSITQEESNARLYCVGKRPYKRLSATVDAEVRFYEAPTGVNGVPGLLMRLAQDLLEEIDKGEIATLSAVTARFEGAGRFAAVRTRILPAESAVGANPLWPTGYQTPKHLEGSLIREHTYITLYELFLDALASEYGMRLVTTESAQEWLDDTMSSVQRDLRATRREATTQEVLDIVTSARLRGMKR